MTIDMSIVGSNLKSLREGMGLGQKNVASYLGVDQSLVSKFESGERAISADMLDKLSALFCCPVSKIVTPDAGKPSLAFAFRANRLDGSDLKAVAVINKIALNQLHMDRLTGDAADA
ncbi:MAG: helix-turn-helix transcriptional regulator [Clostridia bacterium]|nr:helix-turn-helix transcriptional regulator [Clostridia bacterium]